MKLPRFFITACLIASCLALGPSRCRADLVFLVTMDTSSLQVANGPYYLDYQLNDGGGGPVGGNNTATIGRLAGYQALDAPLSNYGLGVSGGFSSSGGILSLTDQIDPNPPIPGTGGINEYTQGFTPGRSLSFLVDLTTNPDNGLSPDQFLFSIFYTDSTGTPQFIPTVSPLGYSFVSVSINSTSPLIQAYASDSSTAPSGINVPTPNITIQPTTVPEPATAFLCVSGLSCMWWTFRKRAGGRS